ncbi:MAG TPA: hypothetical protein VGD65_03995 [Chryseosolibacter sp.]
MKLEDAALTSLFPRLLHDGDWDTLDSVLLSDHKGANKFFRLKEQKAMAGSYWEDLSTYLKEASRLYSGSEGLHNGSLRLFRVSLMMATLRARAQGLPRSCYRSYIESGLLDAQTIYSYASILVNPERRSQALAQLFSMLPGYLLDAVHQALFDSSRDIVSSDNKTIQMAALASGMPASIQNRYLEAISKETNEGSRAGGLGKILPGLRYPEQLARAKEIIEQITSDSLRLLTLAELSQHLPDGEQQSLRKNIIRGSYHLEEADRARVLTSVIEKMYLEEFIEIVERYPDEHPNNAAYWKKYTFCNPDTSYRYWSHVVELGSDAPIDGDCLGEVCAELFRAHKSTEAFRLMSGELSQINYSRVILKVLPNLNGLEDIRAVWRLAKEHVTEDLDKSSVGMAFSKSNSLDAEIIEEIVEWLNPGAYYSTATWYSFLKNHRDKDLLCIHRIVLKRLEDVRLNRQWDSYVCLIALASEFQDEDNVRKYLSLIPPNEDTMNTATLDDRTLMSNLVFYVVKRGWFTELRNLVKKGYYGYDEVWSENYLEIREHLPALLAFQLEAADKDQAVHALTGIVRASRLAFDPSLLSMVDKIANQPMKYDSLINLFAVADSGLIDQLLERIFFCMRSMHDRPSRWQQLNLASGNQVKLISHTFNWEAWKEEVDIILWASQLPVNHISSAALKVAYHPILANSYPNLDPYDLGAMIYAAISQVTGVSEELLSDLERSEVDDETKAMILVHAYRHPAMDRKRIVAMASKLVDDYAKYEFFAALFSSFEPEERDQVINQLGAEQQVFMVDAQPRIQLLMSILPNVAVTDRDMLIAAERKRAIAEYPDAIELKIFGEITFMEYSTDGSSTNRSRELGHMISTVEDELTKATLFCSALRHLEGEQKVSGEHFIKAYFLEHSHDRDEIAQALILARRSDLILELSDLLYRQWVIEEKGKLTKENFALFDYEFKALAGRVGREIDPKVYIEICSRYCETFVYTDTCIEVVSRLLELGERDQALQLFLRSELRHQTSRGFLNDQKMKNVVHSLCPELIDPVLAYINSTDYRFEKTRLYNSIFKELSAQQKNEHALKYLEGILQGFDMDCATLADSFPELSDDTKRSLQVAIVKKMSSMERRKALELVDRFATFFVPPNSSKDRDAYMKAIDDIERWWP